MYGCVNPGTKEAGALGPGLSNYCVCLGLYLIFNTLVSAA
jgi:hypothetical protein